MKRLAVGICALGVLVMLVPGASASSSSAAGFTNLGRLPLVFVENRGQSAPDARFTIRGPSGSCFFTRDSIVFCLSDTKGNGGAEALWVKLVDVDPQVRLEGQGELPGKVNYLIGRDDRKWKRDISTYSGVVYRGAWDGIDVIYRGEGERLKYDIRISPGADIGKVQLEYQGAKKLSLTSDGDLVIDTPVASFTEEKPKVYQEIDGKKVWIEGSYTLSGNTVGFSVEGYNPAYQVVIDPASDLSWSTFLGGGDYDFGKDAAVDTSDRPYIIGTTRSSDFPTSPGAYDLVNSHDDIFVTKLSYGGTYLAYSTYLGGSDSDVAKAAALDVNGSIYVTGETESTDFPTTPGAYDTTTTGSRAFVTKLSASGSSLVYSTFLAGARPYDIAVNSAGSAFVAGAAESNLPVTAGALQTVTGGDADAFVTKFNSTGTGLLYSTFIGGTGADCAMGIAVDGSDSALITGGTYSTDFPSTPGAFDTSTNGGDAFAAKLNSLGSALTYSTFLGGSGDDIGEAIAVDYLGNAYVTGNTDSPDFPTTDGAFSRTYHDYTDVFVTKLTPSGASLVYSTYLGGAQEDCAHAIAVDTSGRAYIAGATRSTDFPVTIGAYSRTFNWGYDDGFAAWLTPSGGTLAYCTYLGGNKEDSAEGIAVDPAGAVHVAGQTASANFPISAGALDSTMSVSEAFLTRLLIQQTVLQITGSPQSAGTTNPPAGAYTYPVGTTVPIAALPAAGYVFDHWDGDVLDRLLAGTSVNLDISKSVEAVFLPAIVAAKWRQDGAAVNAVGCVVTAAFGDFFYVEADDWSAGVRVSLPGNGLTVGMRVDIAGTVQTNSDGERYIAADTAVQNGSGAVEPLAFSNGSLGGGAFTSPFTGLGQAGVSGAVGLNNIGLLVRVWGKVATVTNGSFTVDDGSRTFPEIVVPPGAGLPALDDYVLVSGISSCRRVGDAIEPVVLVRTAEDITDLGKR